MTTPDPPPRPAKPVIRRPDDAPATPSPLGLFLAWMGGIALVFSLSLFAIALFGLLVLPPLFLLLYVIVHYFLWGRWLGPRLRKLAEEKSQSEEGME